jgi:hypothetical protein
MATSLAREVRQRAGHRCEYCHFPEGYHPAPFEIDHIIALQHGGPTVLPNLALACLRCNAFKGPNIASLDPKSKRLVPLFNPRRHKWKRHFRWDGSILVGLSGIGRATIRILGINESEAIRARKALLAEGVWDG